MEPPLFQARRISQPWQLGLVAVVPVAPPDHDCGLWRLLSFKLSAAVRGGGVGSLTDLAQRSV